MTLVGKKLARGRGIVASSLVVVACMLAARVHAQPHGAVALLAPPASVPSAPAPAPSAPATPPSPRAPDLAPPSAPAPPPATVAPTAAPEPGTAPAPGTAPDPHATPAPTLVPAPETVQPPAPVVAPPPALPPARTSAPPRARKPRPGQCLLDEWCLGPVLTLGVINPLGIGAQFRGEYLGAGIDYQFMPSLSVSNTSAHWSLFSLDARVFPFGGAFFLGLGFGYQSFVAERTESTEYGNVNVQGELGIPMLKLGIGFVGRSGFVMGIDLGLGFPLGGTDVDFDVTTDAGSEFQDEPQYQSTLADVRTSVNDAADAAVKLLPFIPQLNLIRIGYLF